MKLIDIIVPCYNEAENITELHKAIRAIFAEKLSDYQYHLIFINDGSRDNSLDILKRLCNEDQNVKFINFSRNFGHQLAVKAGLDNSFADATISMDCDLQHPVEVLPELIKKWEEGYQVVGTIREYPKEISKKKQKSSKYFYQFLNLISDVEIKESTADFRLLDRKVVEEIRKIKDSEPFLRGIVPWLGFKQIYIPYLAGKRFSGETKYTLKKMISLAITGITSFSIKPLLFSIYLGFLFSGLAFLYIPYIIYSLIVGNPISGWASLISTIVFFGGVQLFFLGILGIYIGKIFKQTKNRQDYIIEDQNI